MNEKQWRGVQSNFSLGNRITWKICFLSQFFKLIMNMNLVFIETRIFMSKIRPQDKTMIFWLKNIVGHGYTRLSFSMIEGVYSKRILGVFKTYMMITIMKKKFENYELIVTWCHWQVPYPKGIYMHTWSQTKWSPLFNDFVFGIDSNDYFYIEFYWKKRLKTFKS